MLVVPADAQEGGVSWRRSDEATATELTLFHSPHAINLETAATHSRRNLEFQVYHRFIPPITSGYDDFYGIDGTANIRLALAYGVSDRLSVTIARTNVQDNVDLGLKYRIAEGRLGSHLLGVAVVAAGAWNTNVSGRDDTDDRNFQYYAQGIVNALLGEKFALGIVPSYLYNSAPFDDPYRETFTVGAYAQYYIVRRFSVLAEWTGVVDGYERGDDNWALGFEIQTAGHFFKIISSNSLVMNTAQYLPGADESFDDTDNWHLGFNITRLFGI